MCKKVRNVQREKERERERVREVERERESERGRERESKTSSQPPYSLPPAFILFHFTLLAIHYILFYLILPYFFCILQGRVK